MKMYCSFIIQDKRYKTVTNTLAYYAMVLIVIVKNYGIVGGEVYGAFLL